MNFDKRRLPVIFLLAAALPAAFASEDPYSRIGSDSITVIEGDRWYLEEYDDRGRPIKGTQWAAGEVESLTSWLYEGDAPQCLTRLITDSGGSEETRYDGRGNEIHRVRKDVNGVTLSSRSRVWDDKRRETLRETTEKGITTREEWTYDEKDNLAERRIAKNGVPVLVAVYESESAWTETVYSKGEPIFTQRFEDGRRVAQP